MLYILGPAPPPYDPVNFDIVFGQAQIGKMAPCETRDTRDKNAHRTPLCETVPPAADGIRYTDMHEATIITENPACLHINMEQ